MKLTKEQIIEISNNYNIGNVKSVKLIKGGFVNANFIFNTSLGKFIVRFICKEHYDDYLELKKLEFDILDYLKQNNFPYSIPVPLVSQKGKIISSIGERMFFVYPLLYGKHVKKLSNTHIKSIARALAIYHKFVLNYPAKPTKTRFSNLSWLTKEYSEMKKIVSKNKLDKMMLKNIHYFDLILKKINSMKFEGRILPVHGDFVPANLLFKKNEVSTILDFDNIEWALIGTDIAISTKITCLNGNSLDETKFRLFLDEYNKIISLSKDEVESIKPLILRNYCVVFWWSYMGNMKDESHRKYILEETIKRVHLLEEAMHFL